MRRSRAAFPPVIRTAKGHYIPVVTEQSFLCESFAVFKNKRARAQRKIKVNERVKNIWKCFSLCPFRVLRIFLFVRYVIVLGKSLC